MNKFVLKIRKRRMRVRELALVGMIALVAMLSTKTTLEAAPVMFAFEAEITEINRSPDATFDLPSNAMVGDILNGLLQFEPFGFGQSGEAESLKVNLGAEVFSVEGAPLATRNNFHSPIGGLTSNISILDTISVGCPGFGSCDAVLSSSSSDIQLANIGIRLSGQVLPVQGIGEPLVEDLISQGESLSNAELWNRLLSRGLFIEFTSNSALGNIQVGAQIGPMTVIPEPSSLSLILLGISIVTRQFLRRP